MTWLASDGVRLAFGGYVGPIRRAQDRPRARPVLKKSTRFCLYGPLNERVLDETAHVTYARTRLTDKARGCGTGKVHEAIAAARGFVRWCRSSA
jgi:hypothetical protein